MASDPGGQHSLRTPLSTEPRRAESGTGRPANRMVLRQHQLRTSTSKPYRTRTVPAKWARARARADKEAWAIRRGLTTRSKHYSSVDLLNPDSPSIDDLPHSLCPFDPSGTRCRLGCAISSRQNHRMERSLESSSRSHCHRARLGGSHSHASTSICLLDDTSLCWSIVGYPHREIL